MAVSTSDIIGGFGAALSGTAPQYVAGIQKREELAGVKKQEQMAAREKAMYQDAGVALQLVEAGDIQGIIDLGMDRMKMLGEFGDSNPEDTMRIITLAQRAKGGDRNSLAQLHAELMSASRIGAARGYIAAPERVKGVEVGGELRNPYTGALLGAAAGTLVQERKTAIDQNGVLRYMDDQQPVYPNVIKNAEEIKLPNATSDIGKINQDFAANLITAEQRDAAAAAVEAKTQSDLETINTATTTRNEKAALISSELGRANILVDKLLSNTSGLAGSTGPISSRFPSLRGATVDFEADLSELQSLLTLGNLGRMTGVLSESDIKIIREAASGLQIGGSEIRMKQKLAEIGERLKLRLSEAGGNSIQEVSGKPARVVNGFTIEEL